MFTSLSYQGHTHLQNPHLLELHIVTQPCPSAPPFLCALQSQRRASHHCMPYQCPWSAHLCNHTKPLFPTLQNPEPTTAGSLSANNLPFSSKKLNSRQDGLCLVPRPQKNVTSSLNSFLPTSEVPLLCAMYFLPSISSGAYLSISHQPCTYLSISPLVISLVHLFSEHI